MIILTGAAGFIGSNLLGFLNHEGIDNIILVDAFGNPSKVKNYQGKRYISEVHRNHFFEWLQKHYSEVKFIFHIGARTNTAEFDKNIFDTLNLEYSQKLWSACAAYSIPMIYASSAATYGDGDLGYSDDHSLVEQLKPLNPYGESKNNFDRWVLQQKSAPPFWAGLKFFNVYGPNEYHKGRMASVIFHAFNQIRETGTMKLFRSHKAGIPDGGQRRDFIYVKDVVSVIYWLYINRPNNGIYNLGTGKARTFLDLIRATFQSMNLEPRIEFIDTPIDIRDKYQYFTEAQMSKIIKAGYTNDFTSLESGVEEYVKQYLISGKYR